MICKWRKLLPFLRNNTQNKKRQYKPYPKTSILTVIGMLFLIVIMFLIVKCSAANNGFDFSTSSQLGDAFGGLTAPILSLIGIILIFISFKEQKKANDIQKQALEDEKERIKENSIFETIKNQLIDTKKNLFEIELATIHHNKDGYFIHTYKGLGALERVKNKIKIDSYNNIDSIHILLSYIYTMETIDNIIDNINGKIHNKLNKEILMNEVITFYKIFLASYSPSLIMAFKINNYDLSEYLKTLDKKIASKLG